MGGSVSRDGDYIEAINRRVGSVLLSEIKREQLFRYSNERL
jgi:hypothetical protein